MPWCTNKPLLGLTNWQQKYSNLKIGRISKVWVEFQRCGLTAERLAYQYVLKNSFEPIAIQRIWCIPPEKQLHLYYRYENSTSTSKYSSIILES